MSRVRELSIGPAALLALAALSGCFADAPADDTAVLGEGPRADVVLGGLMNDGEPAEIFRGTYRVPVPDDLAPFAVYELDDASLVLAGGTLTVSFSLPEGLLGFTSTATFQGPAPDTAAEVTVSGLQGHGTCRLDGTIECALTYHAVQADLAAVTAYWRTRGDAFVDARVQVASLFDDDPLGVLRLSVE